MRLPRFRLRTLMVAVAVTAVSAATIRLMIRPYDQLLLKQGALRATRLVWALCVGGGEMLVIALFMGALIVSVSMIPRRLVALRKILKRRPFEGSGSV
jgi:hypothetical protein